MQSKMHFEDDMDSEGEDEEMLDMEKETLEKLRAKEYTVLNEDGKTLRCPLSPSRKKQAYAFKDLLQHATALTSAKRGPETAGKHSALKKFLETDLSYLSTPPVERLLKVEKILPRGRPGEDMLVCPWFVVIYNIDNTRRDLSMPDIRVGLGRTELKSYFGEFNPVQVEVGWDVQGHLGICVVDFGRELAGLRNAQALDYSFLKKDHGVRDYERNLAYGNLGEQFYGWLAREDDFSGRRRGRQGKGVGKLLRKAGNLKDIEMVGEETRRMHDQQVQQLAATVTKKIKENENLKTEKAIIRINGENERRELEEAHKRNLETVRMKERLMEDNFAQEAIAMGQALAKKAAELLQANKELQAKKSKTKSSAEEEQIRIEVEKNEQLRREIAKLQDKLQQRNAESVEQNRKHEGKYARLVEQKFKDELRLAEQHIAEAERNQLKNKLEHEKLLNEFNNMAIKADSGQESKSMEELEKSNKRVQELEMELAAMESSKEFDYDTINALVVKQRESSEELVLAKTKTIEVLRRLEKSKEVIDVAFKKKKLDVKVEVHMAGSIDSSLWPRVFAKRDKNDPDWGIVMTVFLSEWDRNIRDSSFQPFKIVQVGSEDKWEKRVDHENPKLVSIKEYGEDVYNSIVTALLEIEEYNASGRYPIAVAWVFEERRPATLTEVILYVGDVIQALLAQNAPRKKPRH